MPTEREIEVVAQEIHQEFRMTDWDEGGAENSEERLISKVVAKVALEAAEQVRAEAAPPMSKQSCMKRGSALHPKDK